jgi:hypothetical protein
MHKDITPMPNVTCAEEEGQKTEQSRRRDEEVK